MQNREFNAHCAGAPYKVHPCIFKVRSRELALIIVFATSLAACSSSSDPLPQDDSLPDQQPGVVTQPVTQPVAPPDAQPEPVSVAPAADFSRSLTSGTSPLVIQFTDNSMAGSSPITNWLWEFGDGQISTDPNPSHTYTAVGTFDVSLTVTNSVGTNSRSEVDAVVVTQALPASFIQGPSTIPVPASIDDTLPDLSNERLVRETLVNEFNPIVNQLRFTSWNGTLGVGDCRPGQALPQLPPPPGVSPGAFASAIPARSSQNSLIDIYGGAFYNAPSLPTIPGRMLLIGQFNNANDPLNDGRSFDLTGPSSVNGRWESCEERTPFLQDSFTSYILSYPQKLQEWPRLRHYKVWKKLFQRSDSSSLGSSSRTIIETTGISETESQSFTASITATIATSPPAATGGVNASLSATLSETFGESVTVFTTNTIIDDYPVESFLEPEYGLLYSVWVEVDRFAIEGATRGILWQDPNYVVPQDQLEFRASSQTTFAIQRAWFLLP